MKLRNGVNVASWIVAYKTNQELGCVKYFPDCFICNCCGTEVSIIRDYCPGCGSAMTVKVIDNRSAREKMKDLSIVKCKLSSLYGKIYVDTDSVRGEDDG